MAHQTDRLILRHLSTRHWVSTKSELIAAGISGRSIERRIRSSVLHSFGHGVVGIEDPSEPARQQLAVALLMHPSGALSHQTAANLHALPHHRGNRSQTAVHLVIPHASTRAAAEFRTHQTRHLPESDLTVADTFRITTVERTLCDLATVSSLHRLIWLFEWALKERVTDRARLQACARALNRRGRTGTVKRREALDSIVEDHPIELSELERLFLALVSTIGLEGLELQFQPPWYDGVRGIVDFALPRLKIIIEVDGRRWHSLTQDQRRDRDRDRRARASGWSVLRFGWDEITTRPDEVIADLLTAIALAERLAAEPSPH